MRSLVQQSSVSALLALLVFVLIGAACSGGDQAVTALDDPEATTVTVGDDANDGLLDEDLDDEPKPSADQASTDSASESNPDHGAVAEQMEDHMDDESMGNDSDATAMDDTDGTDLVIHVEMNEFGYELVETTIPAGSTVRFDFVNVGVIEHEAMFGTTHEQEEFADSAAHGVHGEDGHHGSIPAITLGAGEAGSLVVEFDEPGEIMIGCHLPGHWVAGMVTTITVA